MSQLSTSAINFGAKLLEKMVIYTDVCKYNHGTLWGGDMLYLNTFEIFDLALCLFVIMP